MRAVVVGGGVAGAASAAALARIGAEVTMFEAYEDPAGPVGSFLSLAANGLRGLAALGCLPQAQEDGFAVPWQRMWSGSGKLLGEVARGRLAEDPLHSVTVMRTNLVTALREEAVRAGAEIFTGRRPAPADLKAADLVVGADGIWSSTRGTLDPAAPKPVYGGLYTVSGIASGMSMETGSFNLTYGRRATFIHLPAPDGTVWWQAQVPSPQAPDPKSLGLEELTGVFRTEEQVLAILRAARTVHSATLHHVLAPVRRVHDDRTVLVGDAAHPVGSGQGASMAIEDAVVLARQLRASGSIAAALAAYDQVRRQRTGKLAKMAAANHDAKTAGPLAARMRNLVMPLFFARFYPRATAWLHQYDPGALVPATTDS
jgi:2-polyprenyl-6-methoxyphenol hydroxylase-like FAD-dependent oxidoreductase